MAKKIKKSNQDFRLVSFSLLKYFTLEKYYFKFLPEAGFCIIYSPRLPDKKSWDPLRNMKSDFRVMKFTWRTGVLKNQIYFQNKSQNIFFSNILSSHTKKGVKDPKFS